MLSPNVYRTPGEALDTFKWFEEAGGWREAFPAWECALMVYVGAAAMFFIAKRLKTRFVGFCFYVSCLWFLVIGLIEM